MNKCVLLYLVPIMLLLSCNKSPEVNQENPVSSPSDTAKQVVVFTSDCCSKIIEGYSPRGTRLWKKTLAFNSGLSPEATYLNSKVYFSYGGGIYAWDAQTGNEIWFGQNRGVTSAPVAANNTIYATNNLGEILEINPETGVLNRTPAQISQLVPLPPFYYDSTLYVVSATYLAAYSIHAYDLRTRTVKWTAQVGYNPTKNIVVAGDKLCLISGTGQLVALNLSSGTEAWKRTDAVYKSFTYNKNILYTVADTYPNKVFALNVSNGTQAWMWDPGWSAPLPELRGGYVYGNTFMVEAFRGDARIIYTFDLASGQLLKSQNDPAGVFNYYYFPFVADKKLYRFGVRTRGAVYNQVMVFDAETHVAKDSFRISDENYNLMTVVK